MKVVVLRDFVPKGEILPRELTFDSAKKCVVIGKRGLLGGGCTSSKEVEPNEAIKLEVPKGLIIRLIDTKILTLAL